MSIHDDRNRSMQTVTVDTHSRVLTINGGSSTIKFAVFELAKEPLRILSGSIERIGLPDAVMRFRKNQNQPDEIEHVVASDHASAIQLFMVLLDANGGLSSLAAIGHRIVHGGPNYSESSRIDPKLMTELHRISPWDPAHLPGEIAIIEALSAQSPELPQFACFDTAFHRDLPLVAKTLPLPRKYAAMGIQRYGFHGLSYAYLLAELERLTNNGGSHESNANRRVIFAHLGSGCSLAAVVGGQCIDTSMGFTPTGGLVMGRRSGDLDPGVLIHLMRDQGQTIEQIDDIVNNHSGLLGISETSSDIRDLLLREREDERAREAVELFCYQVRKWIGGFSAALGGLDTLVFSAGIGENSPVIRERICDNLAFLGIQIEPALNQANAGLISNAASTVDVRVIRTDEEQMIARELARLLVVHPKVAGTL